MAKELEKKNLLVVIAGPTAVGKTALSIQLAKTFATDIISADSRQFYKEMSIGTAKPSEQEMEGVVHHFINSHSIQEEYNVGFYEREVLELLKKLFEKQKIVFLVGGSGLFIKAVCEGLDELPSVSSDFRAEIIRAYQKDGLAPLLEELALKDPEYYRLVDKHNHQRVIRAIEVIRSSGKPFSGYRNSIIKKRPFAILKIGVHLEREILYERINQRMELMLSQGLLEEAKALHPFKEKNALKTVGYEEIFDFLEQKTNWEETVFLLKRNSRRYAKRQMTWFRKDKEFHWFYPQQIEEIEKTILEHLHAIELP